MQETGSIKKVAFVTLGCKANWTDTQELIARFENAGLEIVSFNSNADVYIINTCSVTAIADAQSRQMLSKAKRKKPEALVIACGCMGEVSKKELSELEFVDAVFGTSNRAKVADYVLSRLNIPKAEHDLSNMDMLTTHSQSRARAFFKIQDGCDNSCAYCIVPLARGRSRSRTVEDIVESCRKLSKAYHEIILTGIDISQYGHDLSGGINLPKLLKVLVEGDGISRIRISSVSPAIIDDDFVSLLENSREKICRHVHLSIQSASDKVLSNMGRKYAASDVERSVSLLTSNIDGIAVTGDVIAGLPGEGEKEFKTTYETLLNLPFAGLHIFPYSERPNTVASGMTPQVDKKTRKERAAILREMAVAKRKDFLIKQVGKRMKVIVTSQTDDEEGLVNAFSDNAISVNLPSGKVEYSDIGSATITEADKLKVKGIWN